MAATCLFGLIGWSVIYSQLLFELKLSIGIALGILLGLSLILCTMRFKNKWLKRLNQYLTSLAKLSDIRNAKVVLLSMLRYLCFSHQFYWLLWLFQPQLNYVQVMPIIFSIYFISSFIPTFLILDSTVKASLGLVLLNNYLSSEFIIVVSLLMWIFNFGIPALFGNLLLLKSGRITFQPKQAL